MNNSNADEFRKGEAFVAQNINKGAHSVFPHDCERAGELLDDYVFSKDKASDEDAMFVCAHIQECQSCNAKYSELIRWKNLLASARFEAPENLKKSILNYINQEQRKKKRFLLFRKNMLRYSTTAAVFIVMLTAAIFIVFQMNNGMYSKSNEMADIAQNGSDGYGFAQDGIDNSSGLFGEGSLASGEINPEESIETQKAFADAKYDEADENKLSLEPSSKNVGGNADIVEDESTYEERSALTTVSASPSSVIENGQSDTDTTTLMLTYVNIIAGEDNVSAWLEERNYNNAEAESAGQNEEESAYMILYEAVVYFDISQEALVALDMQYKGEEFYLGDDIINSLYTKSNESLDKPSEETEAENPAG